MSVHALRIHRMAEEVSDILAVHVDTWTPIHQDGLGRQLVASADSIGQHIRDSYEAKKLDERLRFLRYADAAVVDTKNDIRRSQARMLFDDLQTSELLKKLTSLSICTVEFAFALMQRDEHYNGEHRAWVERRRAWRFRTPVTEATSDAPQTEEESDAEVASSSTATETQAAGREEAVTV
jgi:four helix bundle protein